MLITYLRVVLVAVTTDEARSRKYRVYIVRRSENVFNDNNDNKLQRIIRDNRISKQYLETTAGNSRGDEY